MASRLQTFWFDVYSKNDPFFLDCLIPFATNILAYTLWNLPFLTLDIFGCPKFLLKYKMQPTQNVPVSKKLVKKVIPTIMFNVIVLGFAVSFVFYHLRQWRGCQSGPQLPSVFEFLRDLAVIGVVEEFGFYYSHRFLHSSLMYKTIHKRHHEWTAPISMISMYCHPFEYFLSNTLPLHLGPLICGAHTVTYIIWIIIAMYTTTCHHSGYKFPGTPSPAFHDYHHEKFTQNFGILGFLDEFHGTAAPPFRLFRKKEKP